VLDSIRINPEDEPGKDAIPRALGFDQRQFLDFVRKLGVLARAPSVTATALTGAVLRAWFSRSFPKLSKPALAAPAHLVKTPAVQAFADALSQQPLLEAAYWISSAHAKLIEGDKRRALSMYFTPPLLATRVLDDLAEHGVRFDQDRFLDPACGGAAFLVPIAMRMRRSLVSRLDPAQIISHLQACLFGMDLDPTLCRLSAELLRAVLYDEICASGIEPKFAIREGNSLTDAKELHGLADVVVCNPPYRKMAAAEVAAAVKDFADVISPQPNLYGLFIALSLRFLRSDGVSVLVTPTSFLSGHSFCRLRKFLSNTAHVASVGIVEERDGVFLDVQQETAVTILRSGPSNALAHTEISLITARGIRNRIGDCMLPGSGVAWPIPRTASDVPLLAAADRFAHRLKDYGYEARIGNYVWNRDQRKAYSSENFARRFNRDAIPLLWSSDIKPGNAVHFDGAKKNRGERRFVVVKDPIHPSIIRRPCVLLQRVTSNDQPRRLVAAPVGPAFFRRYGGFIGENHTVTLVPRRLRPDLSPSQLAELLACPQIDRLFRCISGATNVSVFELNQLPLPDPSALKRRLSAGLSVAQALVELCDAQEVSCEV
jgi:adenine-specific DNA-methyltransferase